MSTQGALPLQQCYAVIPSEPACLALASVRRTSVPGARQRRGCRTIFFQNDGLKAWSAAGRKLELRSRQDGLVRCSASVEAIANSEDEPERESSDTVQEEASTTNGTQPGWAAACAYLTQLFPLWVAAAALAGLLYPPLFAWVKGPFLVYGVAVTMLGMGTTLSLEDFQGALKMPFQLSTGVLLQYTVMPLLGTLLASAFGLPRYFAVGLILVSCCPGGTASNIVTYLARGNVALSVLMTAFSTILAAVLTPLLTARLAGKWVPVDALALFVSTLQVVVLPVAVGAFLNRRFPRVVRATAPAAPLVAVLTVALIVGSAISQSAGAIIQSGSTVAGAVVALHAGGFGLGYAGSRLLGCDEGSARTISIEVGMQNSVLGVILALKHFEDPLSAVPCALSSVCHSTMGSMLAGFWRTRPVKNADVKVSKGILLA